MPARWLAIPALALATAIAVASGAAQEPAVVVTAKDDGRTLTLRKGQELHVNLETNPSTGYGWKVALNPSPVLEQEGEPTRLFDQTPDTAVGARSVEIWRFRAAEKGRRTLRMEYRRPWERDVLPAGILTLRVVVE